MTQRRYSNFRTSLELLITHQMEDRTRKVKLFTICMNLTDGKMEDKKKKNEVEKWRR